MGYHLTCSVSIFCMCIIHGGRDIWFFAFNSYDADAIGERLERRNKYKINMTQLLIPIKPLSNWNKKVTRMLK